MPFRSFAASLRRTGRRMRSADHRWTLTGGNRVLNKLQKTSVRLHGNHVERNEHIGIKRGANHVSVMSVEDTWIVPGAIIGGGGDDLRNRKNLTIAPDLPPIPEDSFFGGTCWLPGIIRHFPVKLLRR